MFLSIKSHAIIGLDVGANNVVGGARQQTPWPLQDIGLT